MAREMTAEVIDVFWDVLMMKLGSFLRERSIEIWHGLSSYSVQASIPWDLDICGFFFIGVKDETYMDMCSLSLFTCSPRCAEVALRGRYARPFWVCPYWSELRKIPSPTALPENIHFLVHVLLLCYILSKQEIDRKWEKVRETMVKNKRKSRWLIKEVITYFYSLLVKVHSILLWSNFSLT